MKTKHFPISIRYAKLIFRLFILIQFPPVSFYYQFLVLDPNNLNFHLIVINFWEKINFSMKIVLLLLIR